MERKVTCACHHPGMAQASTHLCGASKRLLGTLHHTLRSKSSRGKLGEWLQAGALPSLRHCYIAVAVHSTQRWCAQVSIAAPTWPSPAPSLPAAALLAVGEAAGDSSPPTPTPLPPPLTMAG